MAKQTLCFTHLVPGQCGTQLAPVRGYLGWCGGLESYESWVLNDSLPMTGTAVIFR